MGRKPLYSKEEILEKGIQYLWEHGYHGTSVKDVVEAAGIPKGSFYAYFPSKEEFAVEALQAYANRGQALMQNTLHNDALTPKERIIRFYQKRAEDSKNSEFRLGCLNANLTQEMAGNNESIRKTTCGIMQQFQQPLQKAFLLAQQANQMTTEFTAEELVIFLESAWSGVLTSSKSNRNDQNFKVFVKFLDHFLR